jgi:hypothetical protein
MIIRRMVKWPRNREGSRKLLIVWMILKSFIQMSVHESYSNQGHWNNWDRGNWILALNFRGRHKLSCMLQYLLWWALLYFSYCKRGLITGDPKDIFFVRLSSTLQQTLKMAWIGTSHTKITKCRRWSRQWQLSICKLISHQQQRKRQLHMKSIITPNKLQHQNSMLI